MTEQKVTIVTIVFIVVVLILGGVGVYFLQFDMLAAKKTELAKENKKRDEMQAKQAELPKLRAVDAELPARIEKLGRQIPMLERNTFNRHIEHIYALRKKAGIIIDKIEVGKAPRTTGVGAARPAGAAGGGAAAAKPEEGYFDLTVRGGFFDLVRFLQMLERSDVIVIVQSYSIKRGRLATGGDKNLEKLTPPKEMKVSIKTYGFKPAEEKKDDKKTAGK